MTPMILKVVSMQTKYIGSLKLSCCNKNVLPIGNAIKSLARIVRKFYPMTNLIK